MRIKSLEIHGFKSFVEKTVFRFQPGVTGIVGPNGCGKSNVVDAVRWAMGEQAPRRLRGKGMEDMIFAGAEARTAVGMAEVALTFDNSDGSAPPTFAAFSEIRVARRVYRSGESEYLINKAPCRLRDVLDFFRDTGIGTKGYTIVEQGRIAEIVSAKPDDRRILIEEAAGISKYKARRREAESKIKSTEQNLNRVSDVLGEIKRQIGSLERQARKAARYKRLKEELRVLDLSVSRDERQELLEAMETSGAALTTLRDEVTALETRMAERELAFENKRVEMTEREQVLNQGSEALFELRGQIKELESRIAYEKRERENLTEAAITKAEERAKLRQQITATDAELQRAEDELQAVEASSAAAATRLAEAESEARKAVESLRVLEREREERNGGLVEVITGIARAEDRTQALETRRTELERRMRGADESLETQGAEVAQVGREEKELEARLRDLLAERDRLMHGLRDALDGQTRQAEAAREVAESLRALRERRETVRARLQSLRELLAGGEDLAGGVRFLLDHESEHAGLRGLVRDQLDVDPEVSHAVDAVLAERAGALFVNDLEGALTALEALRRGEGGRALLLVDPGDRAEPQGIVPLGAPLLERVRPRPGAEALARVLLGGVNLVPDLAEPVRLYGAGRMPASFVTPDGDLLTPDGCVRGGARADLGSFARRGELEQLEGEQADLDQRVETREREREEADAAAARSVEEVENLRSRHHSAALAVASLEGDIERTRERVKVLGESRERGVNEREEMLSELQGLGGELQTLAVQLEGARGERVTRQRELEDLAVRVSGAAREVTRQEASATEVRVEHAGRVERRDRLSEEKVRLATQVADQRAWVERRDQEISAGEARCEELVTSVAEAEQLLVVRLREEEEARASNEEKRDAYEREAALARELEEEVRGLRSDINGRREGLQQAELDLRDREFRLRQLDDNVRERWDVELASWAPPAPGETPAPPPLVTPPQEAAPVEGEATAPEDGAAEPTGAEQEETAAYVPDPALFELPTDERRKRCADVRRKLEALGEVNLGAIEEHEELRERFRFLSEQKEDLEGTLASLREAIQRINRTSRRRFRETFEAVNERFQQNFPRLFRGGKASLSLTESDDVLEAGIEIMAQPPGKRLQSVSLLSGGEKTLTALALLVALFQVRPSPFFLLDEVDAALDDANVGRFNEIVREMSKESQFLVITHNKRTIEIADVLYGLTMERRGVSKLVTVDLQSA